MPETGQTVQDYCYLLHFEAPYHHALHYIGATRDLRARLHQHATGGARAARLMQVVIAEGLEWELAAVFAPGFQTESKLKRTKHAHRYCPICSMEPKSPKGATAIDITLLRIPTTSTQWRQEQ